MEPKTIELKSISGKTIFEHSCIGYDIKTALEIAIKSKVDLSYVYLRGANCKGSLFNNAIFSSAYLSGADLRFAKLRCADFSNACLVCSDLSGADLKNADLSCSDLRGVNFDGTNLESADLSGANLEGVDLSGAKLSFTILPLYCKWDVSYKSNGSIRIGLKEKSIKNWDVFFESNETFDTPRDTEDFKRIQANYNAVKTYMQTMGIG